MGTNENAQEVKKVKYNQKRIPGFQDGASRYQCPQTGLWRRYNDAAWIGTGSNRRIRDGWELTGETGSDELGSFTLTEDGRRIYFEFNGNEAYTGETISIYKKKVSNVQIVQV